MAPTKQKKGFTPADVRRLNRARLASQAALEALDDKTIQRLVDGLRFRQMSAATLWRDAHDAAKLLPGWEQAEWREAAAMDRLPDDVGVAVEEVWYEIAHYLATAAFLLGMAYRQRALEIAEAPSKLERAEQYAGVVRAALSDEAEDVEYDLMTRDGLVALVQEISNRVGEARRTMIGGA